MKHKPPPKPLADWRKTNPGYVTSPPRKVKINGRACVEIDGGKLYDMAMLGR